MSNNLKKNCKKLSTRHKHQAEKNRHSYNRAIKHQADNEADDEQSDWPVNENTSTAQIKNMDTEFVEAEEEEDSSIQNVVPWWEQDTADLTTKNTYFEACLQNSNYQILNRNENEDKAKEFDEILNGALDLMSSTSKCAYQAKIDSMVCGEIIFPKIMWWNIWIKISYFIIVMHQSRVTKDIARIV